MSFQYQLWDHQLISDFEFTGLPPWSEQLSARAILRVTRVPEADWCRPSDNALENYGPRGEVLVLSWKAAEGYTARFLGTCAFRIEPHLMRIECVPEPGADESDVAETLLDEAMPRLLTFQPGYLALHSGAVLIDGRAVAFMGPSGRGKSTLTTWFASQGFPLLTDDCLLLRYDTSAQQWLAHPSHRSVRLWPDSAEALRIPKAALSKFTDCEKNRVGRNSKFHYVSEGVPLGACFVLLDPSAAAEFRTPVARHLPVNEAFPGLAPFVLRIDTENPEINAREFDALASLIDRVPVGSLAYQRRYDLLPEVQKAIMEAVNAPGIQVDAR